MNGPAFDYRRAGDLAAALELGAAPGAAFLAGGTDLLPLWKVGAERPAAVIDISRLPLGAVEAADGSLSLGALARLSDVAEHPAVSRDHPLIAQAILASASGQVRNMATVGGNLLQRTRCPYFRAEGLACNKREPGSGCGAREGENRQAALFGASEACVATHPSDLAVALAALEAEVEVAGPSGARRLQIAELHRLPKDRPQQDTTLGPGELVTAVRLTGADRFASHSSYLKVRDRASFEFAVVSIAAALVVEDGVVAEVRLAAGGVAHKPWRLVASEAALVGRTLDEAAIAAAADLAAESALALAHNGFKIALLRRATARALTQAGGLA